MDKGVCFFPSQVSRPSVPLDGFSAAEFFTFSFRQTSGRGTGTPSQRDQDLLKENTALASENLQLRFQLEQQSLDNKQIPRLQVRMEAVGLFWDQTAALHVARIGSVVQAAANRPFSRRKWGQPIQEPKICFTFSPE